MGTGPNNPAGFHMAIKAVLFDFRDTLLKVDRGYKEANKSLMYFLADRGFNFTEDELKEKADQIFRNVKKKHGKDPHIHDWSRVRISELLKSLGLVRFDSVELEKLFQDYNKTFISMVVLYSDVDFILNQLKSRGIKIGLVIDGTVYRENKIIDKLGLRRYMDVVVISEDVGFNKNTQVPLEVALGELNVGPGEVLVVGDRVDKDVFHANKLGCISVKIERMDGRYSDIKPTSNPERPRFVIKDLKELTGVLKELEK